MTAVVRVGLTASLLLSFVSTACAECAWVSWSIEWYDASEDLPSSVVQAVATRADCLDAMERTAETLKKAMHTDAGIGRDPRDPWAVFVFGKGHSVTLRCLPDTVDPRGPKTK